MPCSRAPPASIQEQLLDGVRDTQRVKRGISTISKMSKSFLQLTYIQHNGRTAGIPAHRGKLSEIVPSNLSWQTVFQALLDAVNEREHRGDCLTH